MPRFVEVVRKPLHAYFIFPLNDYLRSDILIFPILRIRKTKPMKIFTHLFIVGAAIFGLFFLQSCHDDDDSENNPPSITYPHTVAFSHFENFDFKMWTNGAEVNTSGLYFLDFLDDEDADELGEAYYESIPSYTFTEDSIFLNTDDMSESYPYFVSGDSIHIQVDGFFGIDTIVDLFLGLGSPTHLKVVQGFTQYCNVFDTGSFTITTCESVIQPEFQTFETASEHWGISSLQTSEEGDTLLINNRYVHFD